MELEAGGNEERSNGVPASTMSRRTWRCRSAAALDLAYVAAGKMDGAWYNNLSLWDMAAGILMVTEAGGLAGDFQGGAEHLKSGNVIVGNPRVFKAMTATFLKEYKKPV